MSTWTFIPKISTHSYTFGTALCKCLSMMTKWILRTFHSSVETAIVLETRCRINQRQTAITGNHICRILQNYRITTERRKITTTKRIQLLSRILEYENGRGASKVSKGFLFSQDTTIVRLVNRLKRLHLHKTRELFLHSVSISQSGKTLYFVALIKMLIAFVRA